MNEKIFESINKSEGGREIKDSEVIKALKEKGIEDEGTRKLLMSWNEWWEMRISTPRQNVKFSLTKAKLYRAAGFLDEAWESLEVARMEANELSEDALRLEAETIMDDMDERGA